jgi:hypothetical protein
MTEGRIEADYWPSRFDLSPVVDEHGGRTRWKRRATISLTFLALGLLIFFAGFVVVVGQVAMPFETIRLLEALAFAALLTTVAVFGFASIRSRLRQGRPSEARVSSGNVVISFASGAELVFSFSEPKSRLVITDYRPSRAGECDGAPCLLDPESESIPIPGTMCDAILQAAREGGLRVSSRSNRIASLWGSDLGCALTWTIEVVGPPPARVRT